MYEVFIKNVEKMRRVILTRRIIKDKFAMPILDLNLYCTKNSKA